jgi:hypothetical protein
MYVHTNLENIDESMEVIKRAEELKVMCAVQRYVYAHMGTQTRAWKAEALMM